MAFRGRLHKLLASHVSPGRKCHLKVKLRLGRHLGPMTQLSRRRLAPIAQHQGEGREKQGGFRDREWERQREKHCFAKKWGLTHWTSLFQAPDLLSYRQTNGSLLIIRWMTRWSATFQGSAATMDTRSNTHIHSVAHIHTRNLSFWQLTSLILLTVHQNYKPRLEYSWKMMCRCEIRDCLKISKYIRIWHVSLSMFSLLSFRYSISSRF